MLIFTGQPTFQTSWMFVIYKRFEQGLRIIGKGEKLLVFIVNETLCVSLINHGDQRVEIAANIKQTDRFLVQPDLGPGQNFKELF